MDLNLPTAFLERMKNTLGDGYAAFLASYDQPASTGLRINTLKITPEQFAAISPFPLEPIPWSSAGFTVPPHLNPGKHVYHAAGLYYLQDPAAMAVAALMAPQPGERVLDLAAAPGGKATHIAALMSGEGLLVVNDLLEHRLRALTRNLARWGARNTVVLNETPQRLVEHFGPFFDRVLVDAPCSGEGMFRKDPAMRKFWIPKHIQEYAARQRELLQSAAYLVRPGGKLVYVTCTFSPEENEGTLAQFLRTNNDFEITSLPLSAGFSPGRPDWLPGVDMPSLERAVRLWPHKSIGEGHFIAVMERNNQGNRTREQSRWHPKPLPREARDLIRIFMDQTLSWQAPTQRFSLKGIQLYAIPEDCPNLNGLRVTQWGWWIGTVKKKRFEPVHGFGMGLRAMDFHHTLPLTTHAPQTASYLRGDVLPSPGPDAWVMITVDDFPLGWGKRVQGRIKPRLPSWLHQF
ncbi:MAG: RsmB/NOP family class I SAM-dependent RNA methyltransferase [Anaerolineae bacterium]|nr:RsmB/NOP family class I SAM-dependent RNA methyltransferase [Anaerolineae bacterium]